MENQKQYFAKMMTGEVEATKKVLEAVIPEKLSYTPHERSRTAESLFSQIVAQPQAMLGVLKTGKPEFDPHYTEIAKLPPAEASAKFAKAAEELVAAVNAAPDEDWSAKATMEMNGQVVWESTRGDMIWGFLFDMVHHRGQLSTYLRPMGGKVPPIYGPSADSKEG